VQCQHDKTQPPHGGKAADVAWYVHNKADKLRAQYNSSHGIARTCSGIARLFHQSPIVNKTAL
jgi:hypothetical protein